MARAAALLVVVLACSAGCGGVSEDVDAGPDETDAGDVTTDAGDETLDAGPLDVPGAPNAPLPPPLLPAEPDRLSFGEPLDVEADVLEGGPFDGVADLGDGVLLVSASGVISLYSGTDGFTDVGTGRVSSVAVVGTSTLVATGSGVHALTGGRLVLSPLQQALGSHVARQLVAAPGLADGRLGLWIVCDDALFAWRDGGLREVRVRDLSFSGARVAWGAPFRSQPALWVAAADGTLHALVLRTDGLSAWKVRSGFDATSLAAAPDGTVWAVADGDLWSLEPTGRWRWFRPEPAVVAVHAEPGAASIWLRHADGLSVGLSGTFRAIRVNGTAGLDGFSDSYTGSRGALLLTAPSSLVRVRTTREVWIEGPAPNVGLDRESSPFDVRVRSRVPDRVGSYALTLDGRPVEVDADGRARIDPAALSLGAHVLSATVRFTDVPTPGAATLPFRITTTFVPTWATDIAPIVNDNCASCHGEGKFAHPLWRRTDWLRTSGGVLEADRALESIRSGRMPLGGPPLTSAELGTLEAWVNGGFPEGT